MIFDPDDEPLEFCAGYDGPEPSRFYAPLGDSDLAEIAAVERGLPCEFTQNRGRLAFDLWCLGRIFENELAEVAAAHGLT